MNQNLIDKLKNSRYSFRSKFLCLWTEAISQGMSSKDARDYANLELNNEYFHKEKNENFIHSRHSQ